MNLKVPLVLDSLHVFSRNYHKGEKKIKFTIYKTNAGVVSKLENIFLAKSLHECVRMCLGVCIRTGLPSAK